MVYNKRRPANIAKPRRKSQIAEEDKDDDKDNIENAEVAAVERVYMGSDMNKREVGEIRNSKAAKNGHHW